MPGWRSSGRLTTRGDGFKAVAGRAGKPGADWPGSIRLLCELLFYSMSCISSQCTFVSDGPALSLRATVRNVAFPGARAPRPCAPVRGFSGRLAGGVARASGAPTAPSREGGEGTLPGRLTRNAARQAHNARAARLREGGRRALPGDFLGRGSWCNSDSSPGSFRRRAPAWRRFGRALTVRGDRQSIALPSGGVARFHGGGSGPDPESPPPPGPMASE